jgi:hypothetical protein
MDLGTAYRSNRPAEVTFDAQVTSAPHYFFGSKTRCEHEAFTAQTQAGPVDIIDNVAIARPVPVQPGDRIEVRGEMVHDPNKAPIVHWTHHDPEGTHENGFIQLRGQTYA